MGSGSGVAAVERRAAPVAVPNQNASHGDRDSQRSVGENRCVARDLFDPGVGEFIVFHPVLGNAPPFSRHLGWYTWLPHFVHPLGSMVELVPHLWFAWRDEVLQEVRHRRTHQLRQ